MEWTDEALILGTRKYGEADAIIDVLTHSKGRQRGYVKGGFGRRQRGILQPGNSINATWRSRVEANLGRFTVELTHSRAADLFEDIVRLSGMSAISYLLISVLPEREECTNIYVALEAIFDLLCDHKAPLDECGMGVTLFEAGLLSELGFGLDLTSCASTGETENLIFVSPKSARAVSKEAGYPYRDKLFLLPPFMRGDSGLANQEDIFNGLSLTGYFLERYVLNPTNKTFPEARHRFLEHFKPKNEE